MVIELAPLYEMGHDCVRNFGRFARPAGLSADDGDAANKSAAHFPHEIGVMIADRGRTPRREEQDCPLMAAAIMRLAHSCHDE